MPVAQPELLHQPVYLKAASVIARYGTSQSWITRRMADSGFPKPRSFGTSERFWALAEVEAWEAEQQHAKVRS